MKKILVLSVTAFVLLSCQQTNTTQTRPQIDSISYHTGTFTAWTLKDFDTKEFNVGAFRAGMETVLSAGKSDITLADADYNIAWHFEKLRRKQDEKNKAEGEAFLNINKNQDHITTTPTGLQYQWIQEGHGEPARKDQRVVLAYTGTLINGDIFTEAANDTLRINEEDMMPGWIEALQVMNRHSKMKVFLAPELAYGAEPVMMKSHLTVIFDIELIDILR